VVKLSINRREHPHIFQGIEEYFGTQVKQEFEMEQRFEQREPTLVQEYIRAKAIQPQLEGFEDSHIEEMIVIRERMIEEVQVHQMALQGLMLQIYRLQEGIDMERLRGNHEFRSERE